MRLLLGTFVVVLLMGCQDIEKSPKPDNLIPESKMVDVLTEVALLHGARSYNKNVLEEKGIKPKSYLYEKYGIDSLQFAASNDYYSQNYKQYQDIYSRVKERLLALKEEYDSLREIEDRRMDSLRALRDSVGRDSLSGDRDSIQMMDRLPSVNSDFLPPHINRDSITP